MALASSRTNLERVLCAVCALWALACEADEPACQVRTVRAALTNATREAEYLKLEPWQLDAVVQIWVRDTFQCSGAWVSDRAVLTAKHCIPDMAEDEPVIVELGATHDERVFESTARVVAAHPELDVLVLELDESPAEAIEVAPLPVARALPTGFDAGSLVQLAGFGDDDGTAGRRGFLVETVKDIGDKQISVTAEGFGGACFGDSGGPLLVRDDDGLPRTLGVLTSGSASCFGTDAYTRVDNLIDWLEREAPLALEPPDAALFDRDHEALGHEGRCFDRRAMWLEEGRVRADLCQETRACAWSRRAEGYRCVAAGTKACGDLDDLGECQDGTAARCERGALDEDPCSACGFACVRSPKTGRPICVMSARDD